MTLGLFVSTVQAPVFHKSHYTHKQNIKENQVIDIEFIVIKKLKPTTYNNRYYVKLTKIGSTAVSGMLLLNVSKDSTIVDFKVNNRIATSTFIKAINTPLNPFQFNYKKYLRHKGIYHQISLKNEIILIASKQNNSLTGYAEEIRDYLSWGLNKQTFKPIEIAFLKALLLGQRQDI